MSATDRLLRRPAALPCLGLALGLGLAHAGAQALLALPLQALAIGAAARRRPGAAFWLAAAGGLLYGLLDLGTLPKGHLALERDLGEERTLAGTIHSPEPTEDGGLLAILDCGGQGRIRLRLARAPAGLLDGDRIQAKVRLRRPEPQLAPGAWDREASLASRGLLLEGQAKEASLLQAGPSAWRWIPRLAGQISGLLRRAPVPPWIQAGPWTGQHGAFLDAILLGRQDALSPELAELFRKSGLYHLFAISGMNLALIAAFLYGTFGFTLGRRAGAAASMAAIALYVAMAADQPSVDRAALMVLLHLGGIVLGRRPDGVNSVFAATLLLLLWQPAWIAHLGFQLTVLATLSVLLFAEPIARGLRLPRPLALALGASLAAQAGILPLLLYHFRELSLFGLFSGLLAGPPFAGALGLSMAAAFLACLGASPHGWACSWLLYWAAACAHALFKIAAFFAALPGAMVAVPRIWPLAIPLYFALWGTFLLRPTLRMRLAQAGLVLALTGAVLLGLPRPNEWPVRITFLGVGNADCAVLELPHGRVWMIDGAGDPRGKLDVGSRTVLPFLRAAGIDAIETAYLSHAHPDHALGLIPVLRSVPTDRLRLVGPIGPEGILHELQATARQAGAQVERINPYTDALYPLEENDRSLVLRLGFGQFSALFPGDVEKASEADLADTYGPALRSTILKTPHHGSCTSSRPAFLAAVQPRLAIISVGARNTFGHPCPDTLERLQHQLGSARVLLTSEGSVRVSTDGEAMLVEQYLDGAWHGLWREQLTERSRESTTDGPRRRSGRDRSSRG